MRLASWSLLAALAAVPSVGHGQALGPTPYLALSDSPFATAPGLIVETFEDGFNTAGVSVSGTWHIVGPGPFTDSVDADDSAVDGAGTAGTSLYSNSSESSVSFTFDAAALGGTLPTRAGIVWTDVGNVGAGGFGTGGVTFSAFDASDQLVGSSGPVLLGDGLVGGSTAEDRFFGIVHAAGIRRITLSMNNSTDWEVDHLQFSTAPIPEPGTVVLMGSGVWLLAAALRRRRAGRY